jgi:hypothetical protein
MLCRTVLIIEGKSNPNKEREELEKEVRKWKRKKRARAVLASFG